MRNSRLKTLLGVGTLAVTLSATTTTFAASKYATTTANLNFRTGPSTKNKIITTISKGSKVEVISKSGDWTKIKYNNKEGYVNSKYLKEIAATTNSTTVQKTGVVTADVLNVRSGASTNHSIITKVNSGEKVTILASSNGWYKIKLSNGTTGWASAKYITIQSSNNSDSSNNQNTSNSTTTQKIGVITADVLNIRSGASTSHSIITKVNNGEKVTILSSSNGWYKIKLSNGTTGWASAKYINIQKVSTESAPSIGGNTTGSIAVGNAKIIGEDVNLRETASWSGVKIMVIKKGSTVEVLEKGSEWTKIRYSSKTGYVPTEYVSSDTNSDSITTPPQVNPEKPQFTTSKVTTPYNLSMDDYAILQNEKNPRYSVDEFKNYIDVNKRTNPLVFLRIDKYRDIDVDLLNSKLEGKGVLENQAQNIVNAAKANNIDPVYFTAQTIHETGYGTSRLAKGIEITEIADESKPILDADGNITGYEMIQLEKPTTVYNLYGIGAKDNLPTMPNRAVVLGTTRAYNEGWTSIDSAINGAAKFVSNMYIHNSKFNQNTVYEFTFNPIKENIWHQYATDIGYADKVANIMSRFKDVYTGGEFTFDIPQYLTTSSYSSRGINFDIDRIDESHLSIHDMNN